MEKPIKYILQNGMKVIFQQNTASQVSAIQVWVNIGSRDELRGDDAAFQDEGGLAHIQEHMLFQGTKTFGKQAEISSLIEAHGGDLNAWTNYDETVYHVTMPSENTKLGLEIFASMMSEATIDKDRLKKELEAVMEEFRMCRDNPHVILQEELFKTAYRLHPYHHPIIGYEQTIRAIDRDTVNNFYQKYYVPSNMTLVIVSDLDETCVRQLIDNTFGKIEKKDFKVNNVTLEPLQEQPNVIIKNANFEGTYLSIGHHITNFKDPLTPAIDILYTILGNGDDSRLNKVLVEKLKLVYAVAAENYTPKDPGFGFIDCELELSNISEALHEIFKEIFKLSIENVTDEELTKAKILVESDFLYSRETSQGIGKNLGYFDLIGHGFDQIDNYLEALRSVSKEDIKKVAQKYLIPSNTNIGLLVPKDAKLSINEEEIVKILNESYEEICNKKQNQFEKIYDKDLNVTKITFPSGLRVLIEENRANPTVAFRFSILGGLLLENDEINGVSNMIGEMLTRGTANLNSEQLAYKIESLGSEINGCSGHNSFGIYGKSLSRNFLETLDLSLDIFKNVSFEEREIEKVKPIILDEIKREIDNPIRKTFHLFNETLFKNHPYGLKQLGSPENVSKFQKDLLQKTYFDALNSKNIVISIVGDVNTDELVDFLDQNLGNFQKFTQNEVNTKCPDFASKSEMKCLKTDKMQSNIIIGFPSLAIDDDEIYVLAILKKILSGMGGRLFINLRDKQGLAYSITALDYAGYKCNGYFLAYLGCAPEKEEYAISELRRELTDIKSSLVSDQELIDAKNFEIGSYKVHLQSNAAKAAKLSFDELYKGDFRTDKDYEMKINKVSREDVLSLANKIIDLNRETLVVVGPNS